MTKAMTGALGLFDGERPRVRTMPPSARFLEVLADRLCAELARAEDPFALADALILLPNRRSVRGLIDAFANRANALLLPAIRPLADVEDDADVWGADPIAFAIAPAIDPLHRRLELARFIRAKDHAEGGIGDPAGAIAAADELCQLMDSAAASENVDWSRLPDLVEDRELARHWARSAEFLKIIALYWPQRLAKDGVTDPAERRKALHHQLAESWTKTPPRGPVVIAGSTGSLESVRRLMGVVAALPRGCVVLPGLDGDLDDAAWNAIDDQHPQHGLKVTIEQLRLARRDIPQLAGAAETKKAAARRALIREALVPADNTADWLTRLTAAAAPWGGRGEFIAAACDGLTLIEAQSEEEEAAAIALMLREAMEDPQRTAALITPDQRLGRRVAAKLRRWDIAANVSASGPLADTPQGVLMTLLAELTEDEAAPVPLAALLKLPLVAATIAPSAAASVEREALRGPRRHGDLADLARRLRLRAAAAQNAGDERLNRRGAALVSGAGLIDDIAARLSPLAAAAAPSGEIGAPGGGVAGRSAPESGAIQIGALAEALAEAMENIAGAAVWAGKTGQAASLFLDALAEAKDALGPIRRAQIPRLISALLVGRAAPHEADGHPRIAIWGPLEARLQQRDLVILGALNEGAWPARAPDDPFLSRALRAKLGLQPTEARIGLAAHDFAQLANAPAVVLTRAARANGGPTIASRWIWRLTTLTHAAGDGDHLSAPLGRDPLAWARALDRPERIAPARSPQPRPAARGHLIKHLSITDVEKLIRDPYAIYAKRILRLEALRHVGAKPDPRELGNAIHKALEEFRIDDAPVNRQVASLIDMVAVQMRDFGYLPAQVAAARARLAWAAREFVDWSKIREADGYVAYREKRGEIAVRGVSLVGIADRIDIRSGGAEIIDYKSGKPPTDRQVNSGLAPQLQLEAAMLQGGAFRDTPRAVADGLVYWRFAGSDPGQQRRKLETNVEAAAAQALSRLDILLADYADPETAFLSKPHVEFLNDISDYDHLARRKEWADAENLE